MTAAKAKAQTLLIVKPGVKKAVIARIIAEVTNLKITWPKVLGRAELLVLISLLSIKKPPHNVI